MWYVVQVMGGKERRVLRMIHQVVDEKLFEECFIPESEVMRKFQGEWKRCTEILLPGYLFIIASKRNIDVVAEQLHRVPAFTKLLGNNSTFIPLNADEIAFIDAFTQKDHRVVEMSEGVIEGDEICITRGPLIRQVGLVKRIDRHKRLAYLQTEMFGRTVQIKVGLEIVRKRNSTSV